MDTDVMGAEDIMGAMFQALARTNPGLARKLGPGAMRRPPPPQLPSANVQAATLKSFMGLAALNGPAIGGPAQWTAADMTDKTMQSEPQESFEGKRMTIDVGLTGATAAGRLINVKNLFIGSQPQSPVIDNPTPAAMFRPDSTSADVDLQIAFRANKVTLTLSIFPTAALTAPDTVQASAGFFGNWIRGQ